MKYTTTDVSEKILSTTFELLSEHGYVNVSMRDIAKKSGVAVSQITYYYQTKENLLVQVIKKANREYLSEVNRELEKIDSPNEKMRFFLEWVEKLITKRTDFYRLLLDFYNLATWNKEIQKEFKAHINETIFLLCEILKQMSPKNNLINSYSREEIAKLIVGACLGVAMQYVIDEDDSEAVSSLKIIQSFFA